MSVKSATYKDKVNGTSAWMTFCDNDTPGTPHVNITMYNEEGFHGMTLDECQLAEVLTALQSTDGILSYTDGQYGITCTVVIGGRASEVVMIEMSSNGNGNARSHSVNLDAEQIDDIFRIVDAMRETVQTDKDMYNDVEKKTGSQNSWYKRLGFLKWL